MTENADRSTYWYQQDDARSQRVEVLEALRLYRAAETAMRRRTQQSMAMGENELSVLRYLTRAASRAQQVTPVDLARYLGLTTASVTALLDRLERSEHVVRSPHPIDRRKVLLHTTARADDEIRATLGRMHSRMHGAAEGLTAEQARVIVDFLDRMRAAVDQVDAERVDTEQVNTEQVDLEQDDADGGARDHRRRL